MARVSVFDSPLLLGFDHFERILDRVSKTSHDGYPPYNIEQTGESALRITLAVAGFSMENLTVTIEDNQLIIRGRGNEDDAGRVYLHRGIASRQFQRSFVLAEGIEVQCHSLRAARRCCVPAEGWPAPLAAFILDSGSPSDMAPGLS